MENWCCDRALSQQFEQSDSKSLSKTKQIRTNDKETDKQALLTGNENESKGNELKDMSRLSQREAAIMGEVKRRYGRS